MDSLAPAFAIWFVGFICGAVFGTRTTRRLALSAIRCLPCAAWRRAEAMQYVAGGRIEDHLVTIEPWREYGLPGPAQNEDSPDA